MSTHAEELTTGFERLRKDDKYADFTITAGGQDFKCHRIVLAALSPYFEMMFDSDFVVSKFSYVKPKLSNTKSRLIFKISLNEQKKMNLETTQYTH